MSRTSPHLTLQEGTAALLSFLEEIPLTVRIWVLESRVCDNGTAVAPTGTALADRGPRVPLQRDKTSPRAVPYMLRIRRPILRPENGGSTFLRNVRTSLHGHMALKPVDQHSRLHRCENLKSHKHWRCLKTGCWEEYLDLKEKYQGNGKNYKMKRLINFVLFAKYYWGHRQSM